MGPSNVILLSADRNGSTAFMEILKSHKNLNGDYEIHLGECFSQDENKSQPPTWWDPYKYNPSDVITALNYATGKNIFLKLQITWPTFNRAYYDIPASRKIFLHRNLFESTLSRCVALQTGRWFTFEDSKPTLSDISIDEDFFKIRLEYRIEKYLENLDYILNWCNEWYNYDDVNYEKQASIIKNPHKQEVVKNYNQLYELFTTYYEIQKIENELAKKFK